METAATAAPLLEPTAAESESPRDPHSDYFEQIFQAPAVICGRQLFPLSLGRYRMMKRFKVAFVAEEEKTANAGDLLMGVVICSMSVSDFVAFASQPNFKKTVQKWGRRFGFFDPRKFSSIWLLRKLIKMFGGEPDFQDVEYLVSQMQLFEKYIKDASTVPEYWDESPGDQVSGAHWSQSVEAVLRGDLNWTAEEINEEPLGKSIWDYFKHMENKGLVRLMTADEVSELKSSPDQGNSKAWEEYQKMFGGANG